MSWAENDPAAQAYVTGVVQALARLGWVAGKNIRIDYRFAAGDPALFEPYAVEMAAMSPDVILAAGSPAVAALRQQTRTIPIVFVGIADPVGQGFVQSLARPGGNITGFSAIDPPLMGKWLELFKEVVPSLTQVTVLFNPDSQIVALLNPPIEAAAPSLGIVLTLAPVHDDAAIEAAIAAQARTPGGGVLALPDAGFTAAHRDVIIAAAARHHLPLSRVLFPRDGGLMSYWSDDGEVKAQAASYIDRILKGANPADLPVQYPTKYSLVINLKTAKALGLTIPPSILARADEVIE
jgi:putative ABC transport system substrate-binding protein